jgi:hypothetical protein
VFFRGHQRADRKDTKVNELMNAHDRLKNCYQFSHYVIAAGQELVAEGYDPAFPAAAEPVNQLENLTLQRGFQVHIPIIGERSQAVLMPIDCADAD